MRIFASLLFIAGVIALQIFLSKRESRWPGLVLPALDFLISFLYPLCMLAPSGGVTGGFVLEMLLVWFMANIPTLVLLAIYFACREKQRRAKQLEKMNIRDLG